MDYSYGPGRRMRSWSMFAMLHMIVMTMHYSGALVLEGSPDSFLLGWVGILGVWYADIRWGLYRKTLGPHVKRLNDWWSSGILAIAAKIAPPVNRARDWIISSSSSILAKIPRRKNVEIPDSQSLEASPSSGALVEDDGDRVDEIRYLPSKCGYCGQDEPCGNARCDREHADYIDGGG